MIPGAFRSIEKYQQIKRDMDIERGMYLVARDNYLMQEKYARDNNQPIPWPPPRDPWFFVNERNARIIEALRAKGLFVGHHPRFP